MVPRARKAGHWLHGQYRRREKTRQPLHFQPSGITSWRMSAVVIANRQRTRDRAGNRAVKGRGERRATFGHALCAKEAWERRMGCNLQL